MSGEQLSLLDAIERRDVGIQRAVDHADAVIDGWQHHALDLLCNFVKQRGSNAFLAEEFVEWSRDQLPSPPDGRAFGGVIRRAAQCGVIRKVGYAPANTSNRSPKCLWISNEEYP